MSIKSILAAGAVLGLLFGASALAEQAKPHAATQAPQSWAPPAEIANKPAASAADAAPAGGGAPAAAPAATPAPTPAAVKAEKEKACASEANAKGLRKGPRWSFITECMKRT